MSTHLRRQARVGYGIELSDAVVEEIHAQCRTGRHLIRSFSDDTSSHEY